MGGANGLGFDVGHHRVGGGEARVAGDAVGSQDRQVDDEAGQHLVRPGSDSGQGAAADLAAQQQHGGPGGFRDRCGGGQGGGDDGQIPVGRQQVGDELVGVALVDEHRLRLTDQVHGGGSDAAFVLYVMRPALCQRGLEPGAFHRVGTAVAPADQTSPREFVQIPADRLRCHPEVGRQSGDLHSSAATCEGQDPVLSLFGFHAHAPPWCSCSGGRCLSLPACPGFISPYFSSRCARCFADTARLGVGSGRDSCRSSRSEWHDLHLLLTG